jgi:hypothetical protein
LCVSFVSQAIVEGVEKNKKKSKLAKTSTTTTWMHRKIVNRWIEYQQPINLLDLPSNMEIGYVGIKTKTSQCGPMI